MRRRRIQLTALLLLAAAPLAAASIDAAAVIRKVQARYDATQDLQADVTQEMTIATLGKTTSAHGTVVFKKPGKMRWELQGDTPQVIVADGTTLWLYEPAEHQVLKAPFDATFRSTTPISFLTGVGRIADDFSVTSDGQSDDGKTVYLMLVPRNGSDGLGRLRLSVDAATGDIVGAEIHDPLGNISRLQFSHVQRNVPIADTAFTFTVPPGTDVVTAPALQ